MVLVVIQDVIEQLAQSALNLNEQQSCDFVIIEMGKWKERSEGFFRSLLEYSSTRLLRKPVRNYIDILHSFIRRSDPNAFDSLHRFINLA